MDVKKTGIGLVFLVAAAAVLGLFLRPGTSVPMPVETHILAGTTTSAGYFSFKENADYYTVQIDYPATTTLQGAADTKARLTIEQALKDRLDEFMKNGNFAGLTAEDVKVQGLGPDRKYALGMTYDVFESRDYVSYMYTIYEDTLGAHPNAYYLTLVFNRSGERLAITDIVSGGQSGLDNLALLASTQAVNELKVRTGLSDISDSIFAEGLSPTKENYSNFYIEGDTLHVLFPPYQIAAYAAGGFNISIPLKSVSQ